MKRCAKCKQEKPRSEFWRQATTSDGLGSYCKPCNRLAKDAWIARNPERQRANERARNGKKRAHERAHAPPCEDCGGPTSSPYCTRCDECRKKALHHRAYFRTKGWLSLRREGLGNQEIAELAEVSPHAVATALTRKRVARFPDLEHVVAPYYVKGPRAA